MGAGPDRPDVGREEALSVLRLVNGRDADPLFGERLDDLRIGTGDVGDDDSQTEILSLTEPQCRLSPQKKAIESFNSV
jgi:hypothetical protein